MQYILIAVFGSALLTAPALAAEPVVSTESSPVVGPTLERNAGTVVSIRGDLLILEIGDEPAVGPGTVLQAWRRLPATRGTASYRSAALWFEVAELTVIQLSDGVAIARRTGDPKDPVPADLDRTGAPPDVVWIGDRVRTTGAVALRPVEVRVTFAREDLFKESDFTLAAEGLSHMNGWLRGLKSLELPVTVEVHGRFAELGPELPDVSRSVSVDQNAPFGPVPGEPVVPVDSLHGSLAVPVRTPSGDEVIVVEDVRADGTVDAWRYLDPVTLAHRRGQRIADALTAHLDLPAGAVSVKVVPRGISASYPTAAGYDRPGDQVRILSRGIDWVSPDPIPKATPPKTGKKSGKPSPRKRRILERLPELSLRTPSAREPERPKE